MRAKRITAALKGQWHGSYGMCRCPVHTDKTPSLKISDGDNGDTLCHCFAGCSWEAVKDALRAQGLLPERMGTSASTPPAQGDPAIGARREAERQAEENRKIEQARAIWSSALPASPSPVENYLRSRGLTLPVPPSLRYADLKHAPTGLVLPVMVAAVQSVDGQIIGIHRTYLKADGSGKAPVTSVKMMLGKCAGGAVRFAMPGPKLGIAEGIETALSVAQECPDLPVWAALSTSGLKALILPECVREVVILADADEPGEQAAKDAAQKFLREGRNVKIARPPIGKDFNDTLQAGSNVVPLRRREASNG